MHGCVPEEASVSVRAYACDRKEKQPWQSNHFCLMKTGRLAFESGHMPHINV